MSPIRVARFWRVGVLKGASGSMPLAFDVLAQLLAQPLPFCRALVGKPPKGTLRRPWSLFGASEGVVEALLAASPGRSDSNSAYCGCSALA